MSKKKSILLVEDEENLQEALKLNLELEDYDVSSAYDGAEALKFVQQEYFDLSMINLIFRRMDALLIKDLS